jgi:hypothetical protein
VKRSKHSVLIQAILVVALASASEPFMRAADAETAQGVLAVQIRSQGLVCDKPQQATRDAKLSKPDYDVWVLKCENATYRLGRYPNLPLKIEKLSYNGAADRKKYLARVKAAPGGLENHAFGGGGDAVDEFVRWFVAVKPPSNWCNKKGRGLRSALTFCFRPERELKPNLMVSADCELTSAFTHWVF